MQVNECHVQLPLPLPWVPHSDIVLRRALRDSHKAWRKTKKGGINGSSRPKRQWIKEMRDERCLFYPPVCQGGELMCGQRATVCPPSSTSCGRLQLSVPQSRSSCHCFVITASALVALSWKESPPRQRLRVYLVSWVPDTSKVRMKREIFLHFCSNSTAETLLFFSKWALVIRSSLMVAIRGCERLTPIMLLSKKSAPLMRPNKIIKGSYLQIPYF